MAKVRAGVRTNSSSARASAGQKSESLALRRAIRELAAARPTRVHRLTQAEQPFDSLLMGQSSLYRRSRELYLAIGGIYRALLVSSPRTLSSPTLLESRIQYSPIETEMIWAATDPAESRNIGHLLTLRTYVGSLFHEQNHRVLWTLLPPPPSDQVGIRRYLNFAESLVITSDMALGDELGPKLARSLYLTGTIYDPGTGIRGKQIAKRQYRNYLQAAVHATYLNLEFYDPKDVERGVGALFPMLGNLAGRAAVRSGNLDRSFVWKTNPAWQKKHGRSVEQALSLKGSRKQSPLILPEDPMDNRQQYLLAEKWFEALGL